jgi:hypothetical protein
VPGPEAGRVPRDALPRRRAPPLVAARRHHRRAWGERRRRGAALPPLGLRGGSRGRAHGPAGRRPPCPVPLRRLPRALRSDARWFAWAPDRRDAIRQVTLLSRRGRRLARLDEPLPPAGVRGTYGIALEVPPRARGRATVVAGPLPDDRDARLLVRRVGARLCADIDRPNLEEPSCGPPPRRAVDSLIAARATMRGDTAGGIVPPGVAEVALRGAPLSAAWARFPTQPAGPGLDPLRVFLGRIPFSGVVNLRLLDSAGAAVFRDSLIPTYETDGALEDVTQPLRRGRARGGARLVLRGDPTGLCIAVTAPGRTRPEGGGSTCGLRGVELLVPCRPRLAAVVAPAAGRLRLRVLTAGGATRPAASCGCRAASARGSRRSPRRPRRARWPGATAAAASAASASERSHVPPTNAATRRAALMSRRLGASPAASAAGLSAPSRSARSAAPAGARGSPRASR